MTAAGAPLNTALGQPTRIAPGVITLIGPGAGTGRTGVAEGLRPTGRLITVEGNTNDGSSRQRIGVFRPNRRNIASINLGPLSQA